MNKFYIEILDILNDMADSELYDGCEIESIAIDIGYYNCKKEYNLDVNQFDLDRLEQLKYMKG